MSFWDPTNDFHTIEPFSPSPNACPDLIIVFFTTADHNLHHTINPPTTSNNPGLWSKGKTENPEIIQRNFIENAVLDEDNFRKKMESILNFAVEFRDSKMTGRYGDVILKAKEYIDKNYADQNTTLTTVAEVVCLSPNHFSTIFSQECKTTFIEYLTNVRIENAKRLIRETDMKGYDIAYECGFSDPHYFSYIFKKNTGLSPREFKGTISSGGSSKSQENLEE